jgi:glycerol-3-phosphate dehydrogenase
LAYDVLGDASAAADLGRDFGGNLYAREVDYLVEHEWAASADDVLWRRSKAGLRLDPGAREALACYLAQRVS